MIKRFRAWHHKRVTLGLRELPNGLAYSISHTNGEYAKARVSIVNGTGRVFASDDAFFHIWGYEGAVKRAAGRARDRLNFPGELFPYDGIYK